ncbi:aldo/keto reductase [Spirochaeta isovalerica]|uniref:Putative aldo/keto reductase-like oxidoreductase n=1 Tax=Spirochaeta isovalerica TaxID=150 RepID=A0A841R934_9SPIO|nr:aldo/keto reductase [Spirochaeta isovalerica]MBB6480413.1 putative aldo/keto reductase-like oxidoreductase [Spirochaeta isovalerica]
MEIKSVRFLEKEVPHLIFGSLTMAPLQRNMPPEEGGDIIAYALKKGIRWIDTAQMYGSYPHVLRGISQSGIDRKELVISTKSAVKSYAEMNRAIDEAMEEMKLDYIDLFLLHAVRSLEDFGEREEALTALLEAKEQGRIGAVGLSSHSTKSALVLAEDSRIDWYHLMFNIRGTGLTDGTLDEQIQAIEKIKNRGAGFYVMKPLGGGYLKSTAEDALKWVKDHRLVDAVALGMMSREEVDMNIDVFSNRPVSEEIKNRLGTVEKKLFVFEALCIGCGKCGETCEQSAIKVNADKIAEVDKEKCILCGYCVPVCPKFALRII